MGQKITDFFNSHKVSSHAIVTALIGFFGLYTGDKQFADWVNGMFSHWPTVMSGLTVAAGVYLRYSSSKKVTQ